MTIYANGNYTAKNHGWHFYNYGGVMQLNNFPDLNLSGRCGGMSFTSLDYYRFGLCIPTATGEPGSNSRLRHYIDERQIAFVWANYRKLASWATKRDHYTWIWGEGVPQLTRKEEIPKLLNALQSVGPQPIVLIKDQHIHNLGSSHVVVAYSATVDASGDVTLKVYDSNRPNQEVECITKKSERNTKLGSSTYRGFFVPSYSAERPLYIELAMRAPLQLSPYRASCGGPLEASFTIENFGESPAELRGLGVSVTGPGGARIDDLFSMDSNTSPLAPGERRTYLKNCPEFGKVLGMYELFAGFKTAQNEFVGNIPVLTPGSNVISDLVSMWQNMWINSPTFIKLEYFSHTITALPPYVESVRVTMIENEGDVPETEKYHARWWYSSSSGNRELYESVNEPIVAGTKTLVFRIKYSSDEMDDSKAKLVLARIGSNGVVTRQSVALTKEYGGQYSGSLLPPRSYGDAVLTLEIEGSDTLPHFTKRQRPGNVIDSDPSTIPVVNESVYPYEFTGYQPGVDKTHYLNLVSPLASLPPDKYEINDSLAAATAAKEEFFAEDLTLHNAADVDFFKLSFEPTQEDDQCALMAPTDITLSTFLGLTATKIPPSAWVSVHHKDDGDMKVTLYRADKTEFDEYGSRSTILVYQPKKLFLGQDFYVKLENKNFSKYGALSYDLIIKYEPLHYSYHTDFNAPAYRPLYTIKYKILGKALAKLDLPRPADYILAGRPMDAFSGYGDQVVTDLPKLIRELAAVYNDQEIQKELSAELGRAYTKTIADEWLTLGTTAKSLKLESEAKEIFALGLKLATEANDKALMLKFNTSIGKQPGRI